MHRPVLIIVRDGWGVSEAVAGNAIALAKTPRHDALWAEFPTALVDASEHHVGLPVGQMGNSEVGHMNMGAGRTVYQDFARIENAVRDGGFAKNEALVNAIARSQERDRALHLFGLCSDGGVHSHQRHLRELLVMAKAGGVQQVFIHVITDGRDTDRESGLGHVQQIVGWTKELGIGRVASVSGRYYTMDRDNRWERVRLGYEAMVAGRGPTATDPVAAVQASYAAGKTDEFILPTVIVGEDGAPVGALRRGDQLIAFNFRADRMRQICHALANPEFEGWDRGSLAFELAAMTQYDDDLPFRGVAFAPKTLSNHVCEFLGNLGLTTFKAAETEKYAHVTFFWNGGVEAPCKGEERLLISSPRVATYDLQPEMSAAAVTDGVVARIASANDALVVVNFANTDMVGHTGILEAGILAVQAVDEAVGRCVDAIMKKDGCAIITADHGNCEQMLDPVTGRPHTAHTTNPVHAVICGAGLSGRAVRTGGTLADITPTALDLMQVDPPSEMTGQSLLVP